MEEDRQGRAHCQVLALPQCSCSLPTIQALFHGALALATAVTCLGNRDKIIAGTLMAFPTAAPVACLQYNLIGEVRIFKRKQESKKKSTPKTTLMTKKDSRKNGNGQKKK